MCRVRLGVSWPPGRPSLCLAGSADDIRTSHQLRGRGDLQTRGLLVSLPMSTPGVRPATDFLSRAPTIAPQHETEKTLPALRSGVETRLSGTLPPDPPLGGPEAHCPGLPPAPPSAGPPCPPRHPQSHCERCLANADDPPPPPWEIRGEVPAASGHNRRERLFKGTSFNVCS